MKELSMEEKAQRYDEAIERSKNYYSTTDSVSDIKLIGLIFPELKESEGKDEKIRKALIRAFKSLNTIKVWNGIERTDIIDWLEKQGEQKSKNESTDTCDSLIIKSKEFPASEKRDFGYFSETADKVAPKFKVGDWITNGDYTWKVVEVKPLDYILQSQDGNIVDDTISHVDEQFHSFTIQNAKDGDVLVASDGSIFLFKCTIGCACKHYVALTTDGVVKFNRGLKHYWETSTAVHPATKEQRDTLMKAMNEAGYEWDAEKKELKKIEQNPAEEYNIAGIGSKNAQGKLGQMIKKLKPVNEVLEQKPAWSEEDEDILNTIINHFKVDIECTDEDDMVRWLKSLRNQNHWKPSDGQMDALRYVTNFDYGGHKATLVSLYEQLKKLRGE